MQLKIHNTLTKQKENFKPIEEGRVRFYYCGPTVYKTQHIGGLRGNFTADSILRSLEYLGYNVNFVSNYTDVGHLTGDNEGDADTGEDRMEKSAKETGKSPKEIADKAIQEYERDTDNINLLLPTIRCRATDYIQEMIDMVQVLLDKKFAYQTDLAIYFDTSKVSDYNQLNKQVLEDKKKGAGVGEVLDSQKKNHTDFALWFFKAGAHKNALQTWNSPWGKGFPGWHIECSAMSKKHLGDTLDIHMGGVEHISIHHTNEIAQSESANGVKFVNYWLHNEHLLVDNTKMSKSLGNVVMLNDIKDPLALRYFFLQAHYRSKQNFTWEALESAQNGLNKLRKQIVELKTQESFLSKIFKRKVNKEFKQKFIEATSNDFNIPQAFALISEILKSDLSSEDKLATILDFDKVFGLRLDKAKPCLTEIQKISAEIQSILDERKKARANKNWKKSDKLRDKLNDLGYSIKDTDEGQKIMKN